jgi:hypothetical protein
MSNHYAAGFRALEQAARHAETLTEAAIELGVPQAGLNVDNAVRAVTKAAKGYAEAEAQAKELGYASLALALKALGQKRVFRHVPAELTIAPSHWQTPRQYVSEEVGFVRGRRKELRRAVAAIDAVRAQQMLQRLLPVMNEYCEAADEEEMQDMKEGFYSQSYSAFASALHEAVAELRGREIEEEEYEEDQVRTSPEAAALERMLAEAGV